MLQHKFESVLAQWRDATAPLPATSSPTTKDDGSSGGAPALQVGGWRQGNKSYLRERPPYLEELQQRLALRAARASGDSTSPSKTTASSTSSSNTVATDDGGQQQQQQQQQLQQYRCMPWSRADFVKRVLYVKRAALVHLCDTVN